MVVFHQSGHLPLAQSSLISQVIFIWSPFFGLMILGHLGMLCMLCTFLSGDDFRVSLVSLFSMIQVVFHQSCHLLLAQSSSFGLMMLVMSDIRFAFVGQVIFHWSGHPHLADDLRSGWQALLVHKWLN